tara:strand:+ start:301 stop:1509 length:1209 start_codon:yes stop_codon:yes gene_type:complete
MNKLKKVYGLSITINKETTIRTKNSTSILEKNSLSYENRITRYHNCEAYTDLNDLSYVYAGTKNDLHLNYNLKIKGSDIQDKLLYRYPNLTLPRTKVEILKDKYNVKIIRDVSKSDYQIISHNFVEKMFVHTWQTLYSKQSIVEYVNKFIKFFTTDAAVSLTEFLSKIPEDSFINMSINRNWNDDFNFISNLVDTNNIKEKDSLTTALILKSYKDFNNINNDKSNLILDEDVSKICSEDSVIITEEQYDSLFSIFKSEDNDNIAIGLEVLANCNLEESLDKASLLYFFYANKLRYSKNWNSINVKALRKRLDSAGTMWSNHNRHIGGHEKLFKFLKNNNSITEFAYRKAIDSISNTILDDIGLAKSSVFKLKLTDIKLSEEFAIKEVNPNQLTLDEKKMYEF